MSMCFLAATAILALITGAVLASFIQRKMVLISIERLMRRIAGGEEVGMSDAAIVKCSIDCLSYADRQNAIMSMKDILLGEWKVGDDLTPAIKCWMNDSAYSIISLLIDRLEGPVASDATEAVMWAMAMNIIEDRRSFTSMNAAVSISGNSYPMRFGVTPYVAWAGIYRGAGEFEKSIPQWVMQRGMENFLFSIRVPHEILCDKTWMYLSTHLDIINFLGKMDELDPEDVNGWSWLDVRRRLGDYLERRLPLGTDQPDVAHIMANAIAHLAEGTEVRLAEKIMEKISENGAVCG